MATMTPEEFRAYLKRKREFYKDLRESVLLGDEETPDLPLAVRQAIEEGGCGGEGS